MISDVLRENSGVRLPPNGVVSGSTVCTNRAGGCKVANRLDGTASLLRREESLGRVQNRVRGLLGSVVRVVESGGQST